MRATSKFQAKITISWQREKIRQKSSKTYLKYYKLFFMICQSKNLRKNAQKTLRKTSKKPKVKFLLQNKR